MEPKDTTSKVEEQGQSKLIASNNQLKNVKSHYIILKFFEYMTERKSLEIIRYNKSIQKWIDININHYKAYSEEYSSIELDIIPKKGEYGKFINIKKEDKKFIHIYFNDNKEEIKNKYKIEEEDKVTKIKIIIDYQVKSFKGLFSYCYCIKSINFKKFYRNNITDMSYMFSGCSSLKELNLNNFNTNNVTDMSYMFSGCSDDLIMKIKSENKNIKDEAFW